MSRMKPGKVEIIMRIVNFRRIFASDVKVLYTGLAMNPFKEYFEGEEFVSGWFLGLFPFVNQARVTYTTCGMNPHLRKNKLHTYHPNH